MSDEKDSTIATLREETTSLREETSALRETVTLLQQALAKQESQNTTYLASSHASLGKNDVDFLPEHGMPARFVKQLIASKHLCDFNPQLNTSSYVNVIQEPEERDVATLGASVNLADGSVYPASVEIHDHVVNALAKLWHAPDPPTKGGNYSGAGTVGSTEACLLAGTSFQESFRTSLSIVSSNIPTIFVCITCFCRFGPQVSVAQVVCCAPRSNGGTGARNQAQPRHLDYIPGGLGEILSLL
jgi:hypothetical protein